MSSPRNGPGSLDGALADAPAAERGDPGVFGRRRRFVVDRAYQFRVSFLAVAVVLALLLLLNLSLYSFTQVGTSAALEAAPELRELIRAQDRVQLTLTILGSAVFLVGVFLVTLLESHKTAGAAYHLTRCLEAIGEGRFGARARLRKGDNLRELEAAVNGAATRLQERAMLDAERLEGLADRLAPGDASGEGHSIAAELRRLADAYRAGSDR